MARRSSARLRSLTPKRVSLSHDATTIRTPRTAPTKLAALHESDEIPGAFPASASPKSTLVLDPVLPESLNRPTAETPSKCVTVMPESHEMHPQLHHQTTAKPRDEARHLGFFNMAPHTEPPKRKSRIATLQATPTKAGNVEVEAKSPSFKFTFQREHSLELSPEAKKLMFEKREEATRIREQMTSNGEGVQPVDTILEARRIAKPKGRFSQAHTKEFDRMKSIAKCASATRTKPTLLSCEAVSITKSLKRSPSKAALDHSSPELSSRPHSRDESGSLPFFSSSQLPRSASAKNLAKLEDSESAGPAKRTKRIATDDASTARAVVGDDTKPSPSTPRLTPRTQSTTLAHLTTPTQASLARTASVKSNKGSKIPAPALTPAKSTSALLLNHADHAKAPPALLEQAPLRVPVVMKQENEKPSGAKPAGSMSPLLLRTPLKAAFSTKSAGSAEDNALSRTKATPLLSRSPLKHGITQAPEATMNSDSAPPVPFLARSPAKFSIGQEVAESPSKSTPGKLFSRFNLLRQSPMKSILRSPQRLYSDDPAKIAAGTHHATPPKLTVSTNKGVPTTTAMTTSPQKHVDFTSSTKARDVKPPSISPSKTPTPSPRGHRTVSASAEPSATNYPDLETAMAALSPSPQKRRKTSGPSDFTFRAGEQDILFGQSPTAATSASTQKRASTIRVVSAVQEPVPAQAASSKKRKFDFENNPLADVETASVATGKENTPAPVEDEEQRPAKRNKTSTAGSEPVKSAATAQTTASVAKRTTLGVKPKGAKSASPIKRPSTISQSRLNALAQPKRR